MKILSAMLTGIIWVVGICVLLIWYTCMGAAILAMIAFSPICLFFERPKQKKNHPDRISPISRLSIRHLHSQRKPAA